QPHALLDELLHVVDVPSAFYWPVYEMRHLAAQPWQRFSYKDSTIESVTQLATQIRNCLPRYAITSPQARDDGDSQPRMRRYSQPSRLREPPNRSQNWFAQWTQKISGCALRVAASHWVAAAPHDTTQNRKGNGVSCAVARPNSSKSPNNSSLSSCRSVMSIP